MYNLYLNDKDLTKRNAKTKHVVFYIHCKTISPKQALEQEKVPVNRRLKNVKYLAFLSG